MEESTPNWQEGMLNHTDYPLALDCFLGLLISKHSAWQLLLSFHLGDGDGVHPTVRDGCHLNFPSASSAYRSLGRNCCHLPAAWLIGTAYLLPAELNNRCKQTRNKQTNKLIKEQQNKLYYSSYNCEWQCCKDCPFFPYSQSRNNPGVLFLREIAFWRDDSTICGQEYHTKVSSAQASECFSWLLVVY